MRGRKYGDCGGVESKFEIRRKNEKIISFSRRLRLGFKFERARRRASLFDRGGAKLAESKRGARSKHQAKLWLGYERRHHQKRPNG